MDKFSTAQIYKNFIIQIILVYFFIFFSKKITPPKITLINRDLRKINSITTLLHKLILCVTTTRRCLLIDFLNPFSLKLYTLKSYTLVVRQKVSIFVFNEQ